jgi:hypothetical protein
MAAKRDPNRAPLLRAKVREVLAMAPAHYFAEQMLLDAVNQLIPAPADLPELHEALEWNQASGFVDYRYNRDSDRDEWQLTERGKAKK